MLSTIVEIGSDSCGCLRSYNGVSDHLPSTKNMMDVMDEDMKGSMS